jgi:hypothetical protein
MAIEEITLRRELAGYVAYPSRVRAGILRGVFWSSTGLASKATQVSYAATRASAYAT